jgi:tRNA(Ile)-lysidine synthase
LAVIFPTTDRRQFQSLSLVRTRRQIFKKVKLTTKAIEFVENQIQSTWPVERWRDTPTIVAVSGGADSVALLHAMARLSNSETRSRLVVAHVDHGVRGPASASDAQFVKEEAQRLSLPFFLGSGSNQTTTAGGPSESSLRELRYRCLREAAQTHGARYLVTGHTLDDQIETILFRIFRGTGLRGLTGIPTFRKLSDQLTLVRPMLTVSRAQTHAYVEAIGKNHRVDASNDDSRYTRNFLRNELLPLARTKFPDIDRAIARLAEAANDHQSTIPQLVAAASESISTSEKPSGDTQLQIDCDLISEFPDAVIIDSLIDHWDRLGWSRGNINRATWHQVAQLIRSDSDQRQVINLPGNIRAERAGTLLKIEPN